MNEIDQKKLINMRDCWIGGGNAHTFSPDTWKSVAAAAHAEENERRLLALAGQAFDVAFRPALPKDIENKAPLPLLALPVIPESLRPLFRTAQKQVQSTEALAKILLLVEKRGFVVHPLDWMPSGSDNTAPVVYAPWIDWVSLTEETKEAPEELTVETWDEFYPAARKNLLRTIRQVNPDAARELLMAKAAQEPAEKRLPLIELLKINLSEKDIPYLTDLTSDRSGKIQSYATRLLAQLGKRSKSSKEGDEDLQELANAISKEKKGIILGRWVYKLKVPKNRVQEKRLRELFDLVQLVDLAEKLGTTESDLIKNWHFESNNAFNADFVQMVANSGSEAVVLSLVDQLISDKSTSLAFQLVPRLNTDYRYKVMKTVLSDQPQYLWSLYELGIPDLASRDDILSSSLYRQLRKNIKEADAARQSYVLSQINAIAFIAQPDAARSVLDDMQSLGILLVDPSLALLRLNIALGSIANQEKLQ